MVSVGGFDLRSPASDAGTFAGLSYTLLKTGLGGRIEPTVSGFQGRRSSLTELRPGTRRRGSNPKGSAKDAATQYTYISNGGGLKTGTHACPAEFVGTPFTVTQAP